MNPNRVFLNDRGIVEIHVVGDQTMASVQAMGDEALRLAEKQRQAGKPALILDNLLQMGLVPPEGRKLVVDLIKSNNYDRLAMLGKGRLLRLGANLMLQATGKGNRVKYFEELSTCETWLQEATE
jgi:UDP-N-acetylmuramyl pentapeptide synthase